MPDSKSAAKQHISPQFLGNNSALSITENCCTELRPKLAFSSVLAFKSTEAVSPHSLLPSDLRPVTAVNCIIRAVAGLQTAFSATLKRQTCLMDTI